MTNLESFFSPKSVAVIGASDKETKLGSIIFKNIIDSGYGGDLYPINTSAKPSFGIKAYPTVSDIPGDVELVVIVVPARFTPEIMTQCGEKGVKHVIIISAGYGEIGEEGRKLENEVKAIAESFGMSILGPNCLGMISTVSNLNASFAADNPLRGDIAFMSQSGAVLTATIDWSLEQKIGFSHIVSLGNKSGIDESDLIDFWNKDENTKVIAAYLEDIKDGGKLLELASKTDKPVVVLHPGTSESAKKAISSHTGSLAGSSKVLEKAFEKGGCIQVRNLNQMFGILTMLSWGNLPENDEIVILTNAGGVGVMSSDIVEERGLKLTELSDETKSKLREVLTPEASVLNPVDIIGDARKDRYESSLRILAKAPEVKNILVLLTPQLTTEVLETAESVAEVQKTTDKFIFSAFTGGMRVKPGVDNLVENKSVNGIYPSTLLESFKLISKFKKQKDKSVKIDIEKKDDSLSEIFENVLSEGRDALSSDEVEKVFKTYGFDFPRSKTVFKRSEAVEFAEKNGFPLVIKSGSSKILHKTDDKLLYLNISSTEELESSFDELAANMKRLTGDNETPVLIQEQLSGVEVIMGINRDGDSEVYTDKESERKGFGHLMIFGTGGIYTEVYKDTSARLVPVTKEDVKEMMAETKIYKILAGTRGQDPLALGKTEDTLEKLSQLVQDYPIIKEVDINPAFVTKDRCIVIDMKIILER